MNAVLVTIEPKIDIDGRTSAARHAPECACNVGHGLDFFKRCICWTCGIEFAFEVSDRNMQSRVVPKIERFGRFFVDLFLGCKSSAAIFSTEESDVFDFLGPSSGV
ncbi:hypothetical protein RD110_21965 [Rhodoferax koreense]|uniref:Uncharacterized protein n=1 Tax=Rhodoferax koreensis TaxID=1842727 RepID=A0A1P8K0S7_9BURK|nr:hypothetical protein RD110_21965 [Rhodoferax koreense]